ncbi:MAG TPA: hypothetical protein PLQ93_10405 [Bacteroidia bacterium]|nr:hypothetical protein [Bacteroidia bacterium]
MFTSGKILFASAFLIAFVGLMIWSYQRDSKVNSIHFSKPYKILLALLSFMVLMLFLVKLRKYL